MKILNIEKLTDLKYLNLYKICYNKQGKKFEYFLSSRRDEYNLECKGKNKTDAVRILPYTKIDNKTYVVLIKEFRHAINQYIYGIPAGLVDKNEDSKKSAIRELSEEIGAKVISITKVLDSSYSSAGLTDETVECFETEVVLTEKQNLEEFEDIKINLISFDEILSFVANNKFDLQSALMLQSFYYKNLKDEL